MCSSRSKRSGAEIINDSREAGRIVEIKINVPRGADSSGVRQIVLGAVSTQ